MTCREKLAKEHPDKIDANCAGGCWGCPGDYGYIDRPDDCSDCTRCWDREIPDTEDAANNKEKNMELNEKFAKMTFAELVDTAAANEKEIEELNNRLSVLRGSLRLKIDRIDALEEKLKNAEKDITQYRIRIDERNRRLDEKEAKIQNMQDTIDFQERHINRIEGELKLYKGMKVDTNKTDYNTYTAKIAHCGLNKNNTCFKSDTFEGHADPVGELGDPGEPGLPICMSVRSSAVIGKIHSLNNKWGVNEDPEITFKIPRDAVKKLTGKDNWSDIEHLIIPADMYKDILNKDLEEHMKHYRDMIDQYRYYSRFIDTPHLTITPGDIPPVAKNYKEIADHTYNKFTALKNAGFTEDQAMQLIPMWIDDKEGDA